jgi:polyhydroxyalkanoate synthesis regulator phasin
MLFDDVLRNPLLRKALEAGEEQMGKVVGKLLADERVVGGVQTLVATAAQARETLEKGMSQALHAANLPSRDDVAALKRRLEELESMLDGLAAKVGNGGAPGASRRAPGKGDGEA